MDWYIYPSLIKKARSLNPNPDAKYTNLVVTRWYRPPEILMGANKYGTAVDIWGAGCIFGEMLKRRPIMPGSSDLDQLERVNALCGTPTEESWPGFKSLPIFSPSTGTIEDFSEIHPRQIKIKYPLNQYGKNTFNIRYDVATVDFLDHLLVMFPKKRPSATEALKHRYFSTEPLAARPFTEEYGFNF